MGARQLSGSLADLWPETANHLARSAGRGLENDHSRTRNAFAQWQHGSRPGKVCASTKTSSTLASTNPVTGRLFTSQKSDVGYEWILTGHAPLAKGR